MTKWKMEKTSDNSLDFFAFRPPYPTSPEQQIEKLPLSAILAAVVNHNTKCKLSQLFHNNLKERKRHFMGKMNTKDYKTKSNFSPEGLIVLGQPKFRTIICDNPWAVNQKGNYGAIKHYKLMTQEQLKNMPVADLCEENAVCFMWIVGGAAGRKAGEEVMKAWGFEYKEDFIWVKPQMGLGHIIRHTHETVMIGTRGKIDSAFKGQPSWSFLPRQDHSHKPEEFYAIVERLFPSDRYLELFARKRTSHKNWYIWGDEAEGGSDIYIPGYPVPKYSDKVHFAKEDDLEAGFESDIFTDADMETDTPDQEGGD